MEPIFLFNRSEWNKEAVEEFLDTLGIEYKLRYGFSHILAVCKKPEGISRENLDLTYFSYVKNRIPSSGILGVWYDAEKRAVSTKAILVKSKEINRVNLESLLKERNNIEFDLEHFGFIPTGGVDLEELYENVRSSNRLPRQVDILKSSQCSDILSSPTISDEIKKIVLDLFALRASAVLITVRLHDPSDVLSQYSQIFLLAFVTRAQFEKLILLLAKLDETLDFQDLDKSKKMKTTFRKQAKNSNFDLTKKLSAILEDVELLDDNYRTPETHKMGRILGLTKKGHFTSLLNEVLSFQNTADGLFQDVCEYVRTKYIQN